MLAWTHSKIGQNHNAKPQCIADTARISVRGSMAICSATNRIHFGIQNATRKSHLCCQVKYFCILIVILDFYTYHDFSLEQMHHQYHDPAAHVIESRWLSWRSDSRADLCHHQGILNMTTFYTQRLDYWQISCLPGKSTIFIINHSVCECILWWFNHRWRPLLVDTILFSCNIHQNYGLQWLRREVVVDIISG